RALCAEVALAALANGRPDECHHTERDPHCDPTCVGHAVTLLRDHKASGVPRRGPTLAARDAAARVQHLALRCNGLQRIAGVCEGAMQREAWCAFATA